ncbi:uncharacterized protein CLUP02_11672 [Colletotrichum lupini]|uniref:Uncharacterized protein n=1 Tax=Colletotrichum lupini TaxID=145971 RepID=A0A9Q8SZ46_9PEZI|nr:uncharacterized protein CLUP02_11672 [Colletotrichum lupini]UQC86172.1 hypothetical protein CLUP02_11672 [Colletotrichum lupini]
MALILNIEGRDGGGVMSIAVMVRLFHDLELSDRCLFPEPTISGGGPNGRSLVAYTVVMLSSTTPEGESNWTLEPLHPPIQEEDRDNSPSPAMKPTTLFFHPSPPPNHLPSHNLRCAT